MINLGENIKKYRSEKGLTQKDLAEKLFVTSQAVSRWENNEVEPGIQTLTQIAEILGVTIDELCGKEKVQVEPEVIIQKEIVVEKPREFIAICDNCKGPIFDNNDLVRYTVNVSHHVGRGSRTEKQQKVSCKSCYDKMQAEKKRQEEAIRKRRVEEGLKKRKQAIGWGITVLVIALFCVIYTASSKSLPTADLIYGILGSVMISLELSCILLNNNFIFLMVAKIFSFGFVKMPGVIFSFDLDGIIWLLTVKLFLFLLGIALAILCGFLAISLGGLCAIFVFPFALVKNIKKPELSSSDLGTI